MKRVDSVDSFSPAASGLRLSVGMAGSGLHESLVKDLAAVNAEINSGSHHGHKEESVGLLNERSFEGDIGSKMWTWEYIGLYSHYAAVGINGGIQGLCTNFCYYYFAGDNNVCANSASLIFIPWGFKVFYAMVTDSYRPFGYRRKSYMIAGWVGVLACTLVLACASSKLSAETWLAISLVTQAFLMLADVPADGYSVELGHLEPIEQRGQVRYIFYNELFSPIFIILSFFSFLLQIHRSWLLDRGSVSAARCLLVLFRLK